MDVATQSVDAVSEVAATTSAASAAAAVSAEREVAAFAPPEPEPVDLLPWLPCTLALEVPVVRFTVGSLLALAPDRLVETAWHQSTDVPLRVNGLLMAWTEFEVVGERLAARITDLI